MNDSDGGMDLNVNVVVVDIWCVEVSNVVEMKVVPVVVVGLMLNNSILETCMGLVERKLILAL